MLIWLLVAGIGAFALWRLGGSDAGPDGSPVKLKREAQVNGEVTGRRTSQLFVHVAGAVRRSGVVRVHAGSRVADAVAQAGGVTRRADLTAVNLAARLEDGQQVIVPARGPATAGGGSSLEPGAPGAPKLSLATATAEQLEELDGIGPTLSERIVEYRTENGGFGSLEELKEVEGIGEKRFESLAEALQI
jgi:competence protein ComEA